MEPTQAAQDRVTQKGGEVIAPPASNEDETPTCFGLHDPGEFPCDACEVEYSCELSALGL